MVENIGARRLQTILEKILEDVSFEAPDRIEKVVEISEEIVEMIVSPLAKNQDLSRFIL